MLDPSALGNPTVNDNDEYQFSLDLSQTDGLNATVKIYVTPKNNVHSHTLTYVLNGGIITSDDNTYTVGEVYPDMRITVPTAECEDHTFGG